jgi:hypothetical protein
VDALTDRLEAARQEGTVVALHVRGDVFTGTVARLEGDTVELTRPSCGPVVVRTDRVDAVSFE